MVTLWALDLLKSSVPGSICSLVARGGMCLACAIEKHSTQSSFACAGGVPRGAVWARVLQCCVPTLCGWASGVAECPADTPVSASALAALLHLWGTAGLCWPCPFRHNCGTWQQF